MPKSVQLTLGSLVAVISIITFLVGSLWSVSKISYSAGSQVRSSQADIKEVKAEVQTVKSDHAELDVKFSKHCEEATKDRAAVKGDINEIKTNIAVQTVILEKLEKKME